MRKILLAAAVLLPALAIAQTDAPFKITGKVGKLNAPAKVYLLYRTGSSNITDSSTIKNGVFNFEGRIIDPASAILFIDRKGSGFEKYIQDNFPDGRPSKTADMLNFFIDKGTINVNSSDSVSKVQLTGSPVNTDNQKLVSLLKPGNSRANKIMAEASAASDEQKRSANFQNSMQAKLKVIQEEQKSIFKDFIKNNPDSYISLLALGSVAGPSPDVAELEPLFNLLSKNLQQSEIGQSMKMAISSIKGTSIGGAAPDFIQADVNGAPVKLSSFRGKYVFIVFWASWCSACRQENPNIVRAYYKFKDKNFTILGVSLDKESGKSAWVNAIKDDGLAWTQVSDLKSWQNEAAQLYNVQSIPQNFLIDPTGKIIAKNLRGNDLDVKLQEILGGI
ncbi:MAG: TlpA disulfide reductase family protein [Mucilaginibacter sp.]